jgi:hypothetical protein
MDVYSYFQDHRRECELAFYRSTPDRPVALPALVYAHVHEDRAALDELLGAASEDVKRRYRKLTEQ